VLSFQQSGCGLTCHHSRLFRRRVTKGAVCTVPSELS
jgi:hypothetical protein